MKRGQPQSVLGRLTRAEKRFLCLLPSSTIWSAGTQVFVATEFGNGQLGEERSSITYRTLLV